jgi:hypothetical protein
MSLTTLACQGCGFTGEVNRVSPGIRCACGSTDLKIVSSSGGTGWNQPRPDPLRGWNQYAGPMPGSNPTPPPRGPAKCQECKGTGMDVRDYGTCRACKGLGVRPLTFGDFPEPQVARHNYPSTQTRVPFVGAKQGASYEPAALAERRARGFPMHEAPCPSCGHAPTHLVNDYKDDAWWHCPNCGPLANIDLHPEIDPYHPPEGFTPKGPRSFRTSGKGGQRAQRTGRILRMLATVTSTNPGLRPSEALGIVRLTVKNYPE